MAKPAQQSFQPLAEAAKLISANFTAEERLFAGSLAFKLRGRISARREIAGDGGEELGMSVSSKLKIGVSIGSTVIKKAIPAVLKWILPGIAGAAMFIAGASIGVISVVAGIVALVIFAGTYLLEQRNKNKIKSKANIYKDYFPRDNNVIKLFSQLITLSMHKKLQASALQAEEKHTLWQSIKNGLTKVVKRIVGEEEAPTKEEEKIRTLMKDEFKEIWSIFKNFSRNQKDYDSFKEGSLAKEITGLFEHHFDLGDPSDRSEIVNDRDVNTLWINVFARYLERKDLEVYALTMPVLQSKLNTLTADNINQHSLVQQPLAVDKFQAIFPLSEQVAPTSFQRGTNDASSSFRTRRASAPQFFPTKPILVSDADEQQQNLHAMPQVNR
ncbi:hypothetical protein [Rickettsiella endosymbiont of Dermanyssus gallinae]|uniref:hypothetical protein n=1 Tax=Rickettsiella endosymbiont of Dermanyssus gallinae TaxID=2856608 RepID=UPI001C52922B|nr:hypothetical protein [Rickettsiella endosymbiont of Dermanyssus gallinae]